MRFVTVSIFTLISEVQIESTRMNGSSTSRQSLIISLTEFNSRCDLHYGARSRYLHAYNVQLQVDCSALATVKHSLYTNVHVTTEPCQFCSCWSPESGQRFHSANKAILPVDTLLTTFNNIRSPQFIYFTSTLISSYPISLCVFHMDVAALKKVSPSTFCIYLLRSIPATCLK